MRKRSTMAIIMLAYLIAAAADTVEAQTNRRFVIQIPFEFVVAGRTLSAGRYAVDRIDPTKPNILMFKNVDNGTVQVFLTQRVEGDEVSLASSLIFRRRGGEFYLFQVWVIGDKNGNQMSSADEDNRRDQSRGQPFSLSRRVGPIGKPPQAARR